MAIRTSSTMTAPPASAALSWRNRSQKRRDGLFRATAMGCCSARAPPEVTWNSGGFVMRGGKQVPRIAEWHAILVQVLHESHVSNHALRESLRPPAALAGRLVRLEAIGEEHRDGLREAAEREWHIHRFTNMATFGFDRWFDMALETQTEVPFVVIANGEPAGSSRYLNVEPMHKRVEIGW